MQKEIEIKFCVSCVILEVLQEYLLLKKCNKLGWECCELYNQYYDIFGCELVWVKVVLCMCCDGEQYIQMLKSCGQSVVGLFECNEWDWYLEKNKFDLKKFDDKCWLVVFKDFDKKQFKLIFSIDFVCQCVEIVWGCGKVRVVVEVVFDLGKVVVGDNQEEICELELELCQGDVVVLLELVVELVVDLLLMFCDISKVECGYCLFDLNSYEVDFLVQKLLVEILLDGVFVVIVWYLFGSSQ